MFQVFFFSGLLWVSHFEFGCSGFICLFGLVFGCLFVLSLTLGVLSCVWLVLECLGFVIKQSLWSFGILVGLLFRWFSVWGCWFDFALLAQVWLICGLITALVVLFGWLWWAMV